MPPEHKPRSKTTGIGTPFLSPETTLELDLNKGKYYI